MDFKKGVGELVDVIPFDSFKEKIEIVKREQKRNRKVEIKGSIVYSFKRPGNKECKSFKCNCCNVPFRIMSISEDIRYAVCPNCGSKFVDYIYGFEERIFQKQMR